MRSLLLSFHTRFLRQQALATRLGHCAAAAGLGLVLALGSLMLLRGQALAAAPGVAALAPTAQGSGDKLYIYSINSDNYPTFTVDVGVFDANKRLMTVSLENVTYALDGSGDNATVPSNGLVSQANVPIAVALVIDTVASPAQFARIQAAAQSAIEALNANDEVILVEARNGPPVLRAASSDKQTLQQLLKDMSGRVDAKSKVTDMRPAITQALKLLGNEPFAGQSRAVIVLSDQGGDWSASKTITPVVSAALAIGVPLHALLYEPGNLSSALQGGATASRGSAPTVTLDFVGRELLRLLNDMRSGYRLTFVVQAAARKLGEPHTLALMLKDNPTNEVRQTFTPARGELKLQAPLLPRIAGDVRAIVTQTLVVSVATPANAITDGLTVQHDVLLGNRLMQTTVLTYPQLKATLSLIDPQPNTTYQLRTVMTDGLGNVGVVTSDLFVPPTFTVMISGVPAESAFWANGPRAFSFTVQTNPPLSKTMYAEVNMDGAWRRSISRTIGREGRAVLSVGKEYVLYGNNQVRVSAIDQYGQLQTSPALSFAVPAIAVGYIFRAVLAGILALALVWAWWRWWRARSYGRFTVVLRNEGNVPTDYELKPSANPPYFFFSVSHQTHPLSQRQKRVQPAPPVAMRQSQPFATQPVSQGETPETNTGEGMPGAWNKVTAQANKMMGGLVSSVDTASSYMGDTLGREFREKASGARMAQAKIEQARRTTDRASRLAQGAGALAGGSNSATRRTSTSPPSATHQTRTEADPQSAAGVIGVAPKSLGRVGWWVTPVFAPGAEAEFEVVVQPHQPYERKDCAVKVKALPSHTLAMLREDGRLPDDDPDTPENCLPQTVQLRHGLPQHAMLWLGWAVIMALAGLVFWALGQLM
jgi:hypothetical protein